MEIDGDIYVSPPAWNEPIPTARALQGTYNFNPTEYVDTGIYDVTDVGNGSWTVTPK